MCKPAHIKKLLLPSVLRGSCCSCCSPGLSRAPWRASRVAGGCRSIPSPPGGPVLALGVPGAVVPGVVVVCILQLPLATTVSCKVSCVELKE